MHADCLGRKGCVRAALEVSKFILALSPQKDPCGAMFLIDYYSIRAKKFKYFRHFLKNFMKEAFGYGSIFVFPHMLYSFALANALEKNNFKIDQGDSKEAEEVKDFDDCFQCNPSVILICSVSWYPDLAKGLLKKLGITEFKDEECGKIAEIYAARTEDIWKPQVNWLKNAYLNKKELILPNAGFENILEKYLSLDKSEFSFDVRTIIPQEMEVGRPRTRGNLNINMHPLLLFFATFLPWNYIN